MNCQNPAKAAELQIVIWFLEADWEVFTPVVDAKQTDLVVRVPTTGELIAVQVKSTQRDTLNRGQLQNRWKTGALFDYLVFVEGERIRGAILPKKIFLNRGLTIPLFKPDKEHYSTGEIRPTFAPYGFDLRVIPEKNRASEFCVRFLAIHQSPDTVALP